MIKVSVITPVFKAPEESLCAHLDMLVLQITNRNTITIILEENQKTKPSINSKKQVKILGL